ncbi:tRNA guanosine-2'-O-methyltransferase [Xylona heveae TC161]|uniref:tRNA (guanine(10)-N(2))-methyltransferase n=1 Tax=Xylona heveae (strain CBS 132557 / TC161) TaxID=1328760 RepID=A0A165GL10_XYLHT|nr:tRNA guanosine-2'-O-methyltransferase [Xylona heveae TC161]KZF22319.1 tRNA guanosine-2'-O-methyltransferase [Xylona heveae TC161]
MKEYLIRFVQQHETFRRAEIEALAALFEAQIEILEYSDDTPFCLVRIQDDATARAIVGRSILTKAVYELWGRGLTYEELHEDVRRRTSEKWAQYRNCSFRFDVDAYQGKRNQKEQRKLIEGFSYLGFSGRIQMSKFEENWCIFEEWDNVFGIAVSSSPSLSPSVSTPSTPSGANTSSAAAAAASGGAVSNIKNKPRPEQPPTHPNRLFLGRLIGGSDREAIVRYDLKKRKYISTTSMDAELALVTANLALAAPGKLFFDPFVGTGSFSVACSHFGAHALGSDIDGRSIRGKGEGGIVSNFHQYGLVHRFCDSFVSDLTNTPLRPTQLLDGIICDPPYGVREGLKVLGSRDGKGKEVIYLADGTAAHLSSSYIPPKRPYSFERMQADILAFAATMLVTNGRLSMWMPTANEDFELGVPLHPCLELVSTCIQVFNKWSRRLLTYRRIPDSAVNPTALTNYQRDMSTLEAHASANDLNMFRRKYFEGFRPTTPSTGALTPASESDTTT